MRIKNHKHCWKRIISGLLLGLVIVNNNAYGQKKMPNLLFIMADELRYNTMAAYGNDIIQTPNINRLANESAVFLKAYVTQPVCSPSRSSIMTGLYPHTTGCTANNIPLKDNIPAFPVLLNRPEYKTAFMGKWHLGDELFPQHGFEEWVSIEDIYSNHFGANRNKDAKSDYYHWLVNKGFEPGTKKGTFSRKFEAGLPLEDSKPSFLAEEACRYLEENKSNPFVLYVSFLEPHMPFTGPLDHMYNPAGVSIPKNLNDTLDENDPLFYRLIRERNIKDYGSSEADIRKLIARYWGLVSEVDEYIGKIIDKLKQLGLYDNTIIVLTSDHGDMMGAYHMVGKQVMFEEAVRVPLLLKGLNMHQKEIIQQRVSLIDLVPTLLDIMDAKVSSGLQGKSLMPMIKGEERKNNYVYIEWSPDKNPGSNFLKNTKLASADEIKMAGTASFRTVISPDGWKLCLSDKDKNQLYNLNRDSLETTNLYYNPIYKKEVTDLYDRIKEWQVETGDKLVLKSGLNE